MLVCGMHNRGNVASGGMTDSEYLFHFALWCVMQSPLMIGCDVRNMSEATLKTLTNRELIRINQDEEARPIFPVNGRPVGNVFVGFKHLSGGEYLVAAFNFGDKPANPWVEFFDFGLTATSGCGLKLKNIISGEDLGVCREYTRMPLEAHDFKLYLGEIVTV
jgi:alpha-galactosidase